MQTRSSDLPLYLDGRTLQVMWIKQTFQLSKPEFKLLRFLVANTDKDLSREVIKASVWGPDRKIEDVSLNGLVQRLRRRVFRHGPFDPIRAVLGVGYRFELPYQAAIIRNPTVKTKKIRLIPKGASEGDQVLVTS